MRRPALRVLRRDAGLRSILRRNADGPQSRLCGRETDSIRTPGRARFPACFREEP